MKIYILNYQGLSWVSKLIKVATWSQFSHSALATSDGLIAEAWEKGGISMAFSPWENHTKGTPVTVYELDTVNGDAIWNEALRIIKSEGEYDFLSIFGFVPILRRFWKDVPEDFFCSHFVAHCCRRGGSPLFSLSTPLYKVSPGLLPWSPRLKWRASVTTDKEWETFLNADHN